MTTKAKLPLRCLAENIMGHEFVVVQPSTHWTAVDGWSVCANLNSLQRARDEAAGKPGSRIYQKWGDTYRKIAKR